METEIVNFIPTGCEFMFYSLSTALGVVSTVCIYLFKRLMLANKELIKFASKGTEAIELMSKISKND